MTEPSHAVFLSYASQDAQAAQKICGALRAAGIEVWFDQSELRGGDAWDQSIRKQIKTCALFIPIISRNTHERDEGYFRLEWKLAVDRSHLMTGNKAFLLPVVIDDTRDDDEADQTTGEVAAYQRAAAAADKAIALAPASPAGYWARGTLRYLNSFDWEGARADFEKALALDANDVNTLVSYGRLQATLNRMPEAIALTRRALALDPLSADAWDWMGYYFLCSGQLTEARDTVARRGSKDPSYNGTDWMIELIAGEPRAALTAAHRGGFREISLFGTALAEHSLGHGAESQRALDVLTRERADTWAYQIAETHAWRGERNQAFEWLERSYRQKDAGLTRLAIDPLLKSLHNDRRLEALLRRMNLPD